MLLKEIIPTLAKLSNTQVTFPAGGFIKIGGRYYKNDVSLTLSTATGLDTGSIANLTFYYVYAVIVSGSMILKASTSSQAPAGYSGYRKVGAFYTNSTGAIVRTYTFGDIVRTVSSVFFDLNSSLATVQSPDNFLTVSRLSLGLGNAIFSYTLAEKAVVSCSTNDTGEGFSIVPYGTDFSVGFNFAARNLASAGSTASLSDRRCGLIVSRQGIDAVQPDWKL